MKAALRASIAAVALPTLDMPATAAMEDPVLRRLFPVAVPPHVVARNATTPARATGTRRAKAPKAVHPADIRAMLTKAGRSLSDIGREHGVTPQAVFMVVNNQSRSKALATAVAAACGRTVAQLWPGVYPDNAA